MSAPTALDLIVRASRPSGLTDSLAWALDLMTRKAERSETEVAYYRGQVERLQRVLLEAEQRHREVVDGYYRANQKSFRAEAEAKQEVARLRLDLAAARRGVTP